MQIVTTCQEMAQICRESPRPLGLAPTMGALHQGHLALVERARLENQTVAVSIFVNPTQFGRREDLTAYPRTLVRDLDLLRKAHVDLVFTPTEAEMYPPGFDTWVDVGTIATRLEGAVRPGHFRGVATVVTRLFNLVRPDRAYFGQKDGQQTVVVRQVIRDLNLGVEMVVVPTVREADGLAFSSRNEYLTPEERRAAPVLYRSLSRATNLWSQGERSAQRLRDEVRQALTQEPLAERIDYVSVADATTLQELDTISGRAMVSVAVKLGKPRLIDNVILE